MAPAVLLERRPGCSCPAWGRGQEGSGARAAASGRRQGWFACARRARSLPQRRSDSGRRARGEQGAVAKNIIFSCCSGTVIRARRCPKEMKLLRRTLGRCRRRRSPQRDWSARSWPTLASPSRTPRNYLWAELSELFLVRTVSRMRGWMMLTPSPARLVCSDRRGYLLLRAVLLEGRFSRQLQ